MSLETASLYQCAVLFEKRAGRAGSDSMGRPVVKAPVQIPCRISYTTGVGRNTDQSNETIVASMIVCQDVPMESIVWEGRLADLPENLADIENLMLVHNIKITPDIQNRNSYRELVLARYHNKIPTIGT